MSITRPLTKAITRPLTKAITQAVAGGAWTPAQLFLAGEQGIWLDPSDFSTMFQDAAGTTPVTAVGQSVGRILDKSGRGNHATQAGAANKPLLQQDGNGKYYLAFDGVDDSLSTANINFTSTDKMTVVAGARKLSDAAIGLLAELDVGVTGLNAWRIQWPSGPSSTNLHFASGGSTGVGATGASGAAPFTAVLTGIADIAGDHVSWRKDGVVGATSTGDQGTGAYGNKPLFIGRRNNTSQPFNGNIYQLIVRGAATPLADIQDAESFVAEKTGVTLP